MTPEGRRRWLLGAAGAVFLGGAGLVLLRAHLLPGAADGSHAGVPPDGTTDTSYADLELQLRRQPRDARAWVFKARADMAAGRHELAAQAYARALDVEPRVAKDPGVWVEYAEATAMAQGGRFAGQPVSSIERALGLNARHPQALDLAGSAAWEAQDFDAAARYWQRLQQVLTPDDPRQTALQNAVAAAQRKARLSLPKQAPATQP